ncbi:MAG: hypothetical protein HN403_18545 [Rhodospirillales bacterium]|nr:hypothetical protein [Rhodospirillales bacterium]
MFFETVTHAEVPMVSVKSYLVALVIAVVAWPVSGAVGAACPDYPVHRLWQGLSHQSVQKYVANKHQGDWTPYVEKWQRQLEKIVDIQSRRGAIVIRKRGIKLKGEGLRRYVDATKARIAVTKCLAAAQAEPSAESLADFATAAGGNTGAAAKQDQIAALPSTEKTFKISEACKPGTAAVRIANTGNPWPHAATVSVRTNEGGKPIAKRRLRMTTGQKAAFFLPRAHGDMALVSVTPAKAGSTEDYGFTGRVTCIKR